MHVWLKLTTAGLAWLGLASLGLACLGPGCADEPRACYDGEYLACSCGEQDGYQRCESGQYAACDCEALPPGIGGATGEGGAGGAGGAGGEALLDFMEPCDEDAQCETGLCFPFNAKGPHCTKPCTTPDECPPPSTGCNMMGVCKAP